MGGVRGGYALTSVANFQCIMCTRSLIHVSTALPVYFLGNLTPNIIQRNYMCVVRVVFSATEIRRNCVGRAAV